MSGSENPASGGSGGSNHRRRNYRHFGPASGSGQQGGNKPNYPENRQPKFDNRPAQREGPVSRESMDNKAQREQPDRRREQGGRPPQHHPNSGGQRPAGSGQSSKNRDVRSGNPPGNIQGNVQGAPGNVQPQAQKRPSGAPQEGRSNQLAGQGGQAAIRKPGALPKDIAETAGRSEAREHRTPQIQHVRPDAAAQQSLQAAASAQERQIRWERKIKAEETFDDIRRENERIEKEIWLDIASIHTLKIDI
jgi:hypothetical protein